ncbi:ABC transporter substrate-binding protein [Halobacterium sp. CBA1126]|uniref:ABC transporter substrate-binding protein n=1 Tax=Halobacterium TaxID=2239 RepID=UPI0012F76700|nr:ABC transporter substrate-binding protein [Halobacterium sp. CBA1126]MUV61296.1 ABC transporter substrate-binding protein [Halobacterium sp. CBA1126]
MPDASTTTEIPTRREYIETGGAVLGGGLLAGCLGGDDGAEPTSTDTGTDAGTTAADDSYSVTMEPVGTVEFDDVPETWSPYTADYADMGVALGHGDGLAAIGLAARYATHLYDELPGVSVDADDLVELWSDGTNTEVYYQVDADLHVVDPNFMVNRLGWSRDDVEEIATNVGPFLGNTGFTRVYDWHDYRYYSMYEAFEKLAAVFDERARYEAFAAYHDEVLADVQSRLPDERPDVAVLYPADVPPDSFYPYLVGDGTSFKHFRDLGVGDALAEAGVQDAQAGGGTVDYETLLDADPDAIAIRMQGEITDQYVQDEIVSYMADDEAGSRLSAVQNDRVFYGGVTYQGPIIHLFQLERAARGLYPEEFGADEQLFDRQRVADIVAGEH